MREARIRLGPEQPDLVVAAIARAGGTLTEPQDANAIIWSSREHARPTAVAALRDLLHPGIRWVQLDSAGIEQWVRAGMLDRQRVWTSAKGAYAPQVAELVVAFVLAAAKRLPHLARARSWSEGSGDRLQGKVVGIVGAGAIGRETIRRLKPFGVRATALTRSRQRVPGADHSVGPEGLSDLLAESDYVVLAAPLTAAAHGLFGERELTRLGPSGWLINVGRGALVDTGALASALVHGHIAGACLDVTDPEPLPGEHVLWTLPNVLITPHVANHWGPLYPAFAELVARNIARFRAGRTLCGVVGVGAGY